MTFGKKVAVLGAGVMGPGIAQTYAVYGCDVALYSRTEATLEKARQSVKASLALLKEENMLGGKEPEEIMARFQYTTSLEEAVKDAWYVVETVSEKPDVKRALYEKLDSILEKDVIISSNTSYLNIFELMPAARQPYSVIAHWVTPPHIMPPVEVVRGPETTDETMQVMVDFHAACGKIPVRMEEYVPGFILNRLQSAMSREIFYLLENGYCSAKDIDLIAKTCLMTRGMLLGLVQKFDFSGLDTVSNGFINKSFTPAPDPGYPTPLAERCERGDLGVKTGKGFYSYTQRPREELLVQLDRQLLQSIRLSNAFMEEPLADKE